MILITQKRKAALCRSPIFFFTEHIGMCVRVHVNDDRSGPVSCYLSPSHVSNFVQADTGDDDRNMGPVPRLHVTEHAEHEGHQSTLAAGRDKPSVAFKMR